MTKVTEKIGLAIKLSPLHPYSMKSFFQRKLTRFYIINPIGDRRLEQRFESQEAVVLRVTQTGKVVPAIGFDIGRHGLRIETDWQLQPGTDVEISFPNTVDQMQCFGRVVWARNLSNGKLCQSGIVIEVWHGIVSGENSWIKVKGAKPKPERRNKAR